MRFAAGDVIPALCADGSGIGGTAAFAKDYAPVLLQFWRRAKDAPTANFQRRIVAVHAAAVSSRVPSVFAETASVLDEAFGDAVSNVVLAALRECAENPAAAAKFKGKLDELAKSSDPDVSRLAGLALRKA